MHKRLVGHNPHVGKQYKAIIVAQHGHVLHQIVRIIVIVFIILGYPVLVVLISWSLIVVVIR